MDMNVTSLPLRGAAEQALQILHGLRIGRMMGRLRGRGLRGLGGLFCGWGGCCRSRFGGGRLSCLLLCPLLGEHAFLRRQELLQLLLGDELQSAENLSDVAFRVIPLNPDGDGELARL